MKFTPTAITLPVLAALLCFAGRSDDDPIIIASASTEAKPVRLKEDEIARLLNAAEAQFACPIPAPSHCPLIPRPWWDFEISCQGAKVRCAYPILGTGPDDLRDAVQEGRRSAFARLDKEYRECLKLQEEEDWHWPCLRYEEAWEVILQTENLVSLKCEGEEFSSGAHANYFFMTQTWWRDGGEVRALMLADLFLAGMPWRKAVSERVLQMLEAQDATWVVAGELKYLDDEMLRNWSLTGSGILFEFAPYAVGSFVEGPHQVFVNYEELRSLLDPSGPAGEFLR